MKHLSVILFGMLVISGLTGCRNYDIPGSGALTLSNDVDYYYRQYLKKSNPSYFIVSSDGKGFDWLVCPGVRCVRQGDLGRIITKCEARTKTSCHLFALGRTVVWQGPITDPTGTLIKVSSPNGADPWCRSSYPDNRLCQAIASAHDTACKEQGDMDSNTYTSCRAKQFEAYRYDGTLKNYQPHIIACDVGGKESVKISRKFCHQLNGQIAHAYQAITVNWEEIAPFALGTFDIRNEAPTGKIRIQVMGRPQPCEGDYIFTGEQKGRWTITCSPELKAEGRYTADGYDALKGTGTDTQGRTVAFSLSPDRFTTTSYVNPDYLK